MTTISSVEARTVSIPLEVPTSFSSREVHKRDYVLVRVTGDDGHRGIGFCYGGSNAGTVVAEAVRKLLAPILTGKSAHMTEGLWHQMYQEALLHGRVGAVMRAISALDTAVWDRNARAADLPLYKFLGAVVEDQVPAYASGGYYLPGKDEQGLATELSEYVSAGFTAVKIKVGKLNLREEEIRMAAAREAIGPDVLLMLDANNAWTDLPTAKRFMRMYERYDPYWIEEPFSPDDIDNHARLARESSVTVATGEIEAGRWRFKELLEKQAASILQTDAAVCGGITEFRRIAACASSFGVSMCPHWFHDLHAHLVAATPNATFVEFFPDDKVLNFRRLLDTQVRVANGELLLSDAPGLGFDFDHQSVEQYAIDAWH